MKFQGRTIRNPFRETRSAGGYTDRLVSLIQAQAGVAVDTDPRGTGALETAAGIWGRALSSAKVSPDPAAAVLTPPVLSTIGRELVRVGEVLFVVDVVNGRRVLLPSSSWDVTGSASPDSWKFTCELSGPDTTETRTESWDGVVLLTWATEPRQPFKGLGPLQAANLTGGLIGALEASLKGEAGTPVGYLLPVPQANEVDDDEVDPLESMKADLRQLSGGLSLVETTAAGWGEGRGAAPHVDWKPSRLGPAPPTALCSLRQDVSQSVLSCCGISEAMTSARSDGTARREAFRQFLHLSVNPVARQILSELRVKLDIPDMRLDFSELFAGDLSGRARSFQSLVKGGMTVEKAAALSGLMATD